MRSIFIFVLLILFSTYLSAQSWVQKNDIGYYQSNGAPARAAVVEFTIGSKAYVCGGWTNNFTKDCWVYDPSTDAWTQIADFGGGNRAFAVGFSIGTKGYMGIGDTTRNYTSVPVNDFWEYDPTTNIWTRKADYAGGKVGDAVGFSIDSLGYIGTGLDSNQTLRSDFWSYNPATDSWSQKSSFAGAAREAAIGFSMNGKGYIGLGWNNDFWEYNPVNDIWTPKASYPDSATGDCASFALNGKGYVGAGWDTYANFNQNFWQYDNITDTWTPKSHMSNPRRNGIGFSIDSFGYFGLGILNENFLNDINKYNPYIDTWANTRGLGGVGRESAMGFAINGLCYTGMGDNTVVLSDFWVLNPISNVWSQIANFPGASRTNGIGFSIGNKGYIGTGSTEAGVTPGNLKDFWEYDVSSNTWARKSDVPGSEREDALGFSIGNMGYVGTGVDTNGLYLADFWQYNPTTDTWTQKANFAGNSRISATCIAIGNLGYVGFGNTTGAPTSNNLNDFWQYDPSMDFWTRMADFPDTDNVVAAAFNIGNKGYVAIGDTSFNVMPSNGYFWQYDPNINVWNKMGNYGGPPVNYAVGLATNNKGYIIGGIKGDFTFSANCWEFTPYCSNINQSICLVSIDTTINKPLLIWEKADKYATDSFYIYRTNTPNNIYTQVGAIGRDSLSTWEDISARPDLMSYRYKIAVLDTCGSVHDFSPYHQTTFLTATSPGSFSWTPYAIESSVTPIGTYDLYRDDQATSNWHILFSVSDTQTTASDTNWASYPNARYQIVITLTDPCNPTRSVSNISSNILSHINTGITDVSWLSDLKVVPNPAHDYVTISCPDLTGAASLIVTNILGQTIITADMSKTGTVLNTQSWQSGIYFVTLTSGSNKATVKMVK